MTGNKLLTGWRLGALALVLGAVTGVAAVYGIADPSANTASSCSTTAAQLDRLRPLAKGPIAAVLVEDKPLRLPELSFKDGGGRTVTLSSLRGKTVLLNLWATWCVPCRGEMPTLNALQGKLGGADFAVAAVSIDTRDPEKPRRFLAETGATALPFFVDPSGDIFQTLRTVGRAVGMPTSLLVDRSGCAIAYLPGPAEWSSPEAVALVEAALGR